MFREIRHSKTRLHSDVATFVHVVVAVPEMSRCRHHRVPQDEQVTCVSQSVSVGQYACRVLPPDSGDEWLAVGHESLPVGLAYDWAVQPHCGAVVLFSGTVRDNAEGRSDVEALTYEAFEERVVTVFSDIARETRHRWPDVGRIALLHCLGRLQLGESSVLAVVSAPHRPEAFAAARYAIDALKSSAPIWKKEHWEGGDSWGTGAQAIVPPNSVPTVPQ